MEKTGVLLKIVKYSGKYKVFIILSWIFSALSGVVSLIPYLCIFFISRELVASWNNPVNVNGDTLTHYGWLAVKSTMYSFMFYGIALTCSHLGAFNLMANLRIELIRKFESLPLGFHILNPSGKLRKVVEKNTENLENFIAHQLPDTVQAGVLPIAFGISMFFFDWRLALVCILPIITGFLILWSMLKGDSDSFLVKYQKSLEEMSNSAVEYVRGISVVKVFGQTVHSFNTFHNSITTYRKFVTEYALSMEKNMSLYIASIHGVFFFLIPAAIIIHLWFGDKENCLLGFIFFIVFIPLAAVLFTRIMFSASNGMIASQSIQTIEGFLNEESIKEPEKTIVPESLDIVFDSVSFAYEKGKPFAVKDLNFSIKQGSVTALVGPSGGGKTTIASLIARFWEINKGKISVGGVDLREISYSWWVEQISFVFQDISLFKMTIAENVAFHNPGAGEEDILNALSMAQCDDIIEKLPDGIHTEIGSKGTYLSGGEMQRIALARAVLKDSPIVILDEATAFADPENEYKIQKALDAVMFEKTVIMIAHRLSTIVGADRIIVLDNGEIEEAGEHFELLEREGLYWKMFKDYNTSTSWKIGGRGNA